MLKLKKKQIIDKREIIIKKCPVGVCFVKNDSSKIIKSQIYQIKFSCKRWKYIYQYNIFKNLLIGNITFKQKLKLKIKQTLTNITDCMLG